MRAYNLHIEQLDEDGQHNSLVLHAEGNMELDTLLTRLRYYVRTMGEGYALDVTVEVSK